MESANTKNVKCQQKIPKAERILTFALCYFSAKGGSPRGDILQCCIHQIALGELVNTKVYRKA